MGSIARASPAAGQIGGWLPRLACHRARISSRRGRIDDAVAEIVVDASEVQAADVGQRRVRGPRANVGLDGEQR
jgi:hypothetical protein